MRLIDADAAEAILSGLDWQDAYLPIHFKELVLDECKTAVDMPCMVGDTVYADLRENKKRKARREDLTECAVQTIEFDKAFPQPLFTVVRRTFDVCHIGEDDFGRFWASEFGSLIFTPKMYEEM